MKLGQSYKNHFFKISSCELTRNLGPLLKKLYIQISFLKERKLSEIYNI